MYRQYRCPTCMSRLGLSEQDIPSYIPIVRDLDQLEKQDSPERAILLQDLLDHVRYTEACGIPMPLGILQIVHALNALDNVDYPLAPEATEPPPTPLNPP